MMRLNKYLSSCGICSRREADRIIEAGRVSVRGQVAVTGMTVEEDAIVLVDGKPVKPVGQQTYLAYYKPRGIVCTFDPREKHNLLSDFSYPERVTYAGRLDRESEGLLILTNDGDSINQMMRARYGHEKEYVVTIDQEVTARLVERLSAGVYLRELEVSTRPCRVKKSGRYEFHITLTQGLNRQIRRMCEACQVHVKSLKRIRIMNVHLDDLQPGEYRKIEGEVLTTLQKQLVQEERDTGNRKQRNKIMNQNRGRNQTYE